MRLTYFLLLVLLNSILFGCKGSGFSGSTRKEKPKDPNADIKASEPYVVTGAYLTASLDCEQADIGDGQTTPYGCNVKSRENIVLPPPDKCAYVFHAKTGSGKFLEQEAPPTNSEYQVLFQVPVSEPDPLTFTAGILSSGGASTGTLWTNSISRNQAGASLSTAPTFNECKPCQKIKAENVPAGYTLHWTYSKDRTKTPATPTCASPGFSEPVLTQYIFFKAVACSPEGVSSTVVEKIYDPYKK